LRTQISEQMAAGKSDEEIRTYMVSRYGDFILYSPPLKATTLLLWLGPFVLLVLALGLGVFLIRRRAGVASAAAEVDVLALSRAEALWQQHKK
jgi:cytochrome c-type biogenesis protein CcmH